MGKCTRGTVPRRDDDADGPIWANLLEPDVWHEALSRATDRVDGDGLGTLVFGFLAMAAGVTIRLFADFSTPNCQVWAYGLASRAMLASAAALLAPKAIGRHPEYGGFAIALGYLLGYAGPDRPRRHPLRPPAERRRE